MTKMKKTKKSDLTDKIEFAGVRQLINGEYHRGYLEGQRKTLEAFANFMDHIIERQIATEIRSDIGLCRQEIKFS